MRLSFADLERERVESASEDAHFPEALARAVLEEYSSPGYRVLESFAGHVTALAVCAGVGRSAVGIELRRRTRRARWRFRAGHAAFAQATASPDRTCDPTGRPSTSPA